jgi:crotonobetainyl-CoA:carnitine CoA-transferase CaiB-like acyl-CoA transferase
MRLPNKFGGVRRDYRHAPKIGEHSVEVLREVGYNEAAIGAMLASGATVDGRPPEAAATRDR